MDTKTKSAQGDEGMEKPVYYAPTEHGDYAFAVSAASMKFGAGVLAEFGRRCEKPGHEGGWRCSSIPRSATPDLPRSP